MIKILIIKRKREVIVVFREEDIFLLVNFSGVRGKKIRDVYINLYGFMWDNIFNVF